MTTTPNATDPRPLGQRLKEDNWDLHQQAERDTLPQHLVQGTIPRETYVELLGQMWLQAQDQGVPAAWLSMCRSQRLCRSLLIQREGR